MITREAVEKDQEEYTKFQESPVGLRIKELARSYVEGRTSFEDTARIVKDLAPICCVAFWQAMAGHPWTVRTPNGPDVGFERLKAMHVVVVPGVLRHFAKLVKPV